MKPVSIITVNYNNYPDTIECLDSLLRMDYPAYNIVIVDNFSENDSVKKIEDWLSGKHERAGDGRGPIPLRKYTYDGNSLKMHEDGRRGEASSGLFGISVIRSSKNLGFGGANNLGAEHAISVYQPDYIWFINNDTVAAPEALRGLVDTLEAHHEAGAAGSKVLLYHDPGRVQFLGGGSICFNYADLPYAGRADFPSNDAEIKGYITGTSFIIRKEVAARAGLWDDKYFLYVEDVDYSVRIRNAGFKLYFASKSVIYHKNGASTKRKTISKSFLGRKTRRFDIGNYQSTFYYEFRNWIYFNKKNRNFFYKLFYFPIYLPYYVAGMVFFVILFDDHKSSRLRIMWKALTDGLLSRLGPRRG